ncbi:MAG: sulfotransferase [Tychonema bourrellyi B0820]|uniref:Polysaccharide deacetylase n=1 Tax=Tychonema bourrellyi FEM_GT703 TaxID=2040638 RepID=A0A2G4F2X8_9CYAN|nr:sulfotransferase [Tychonema bourrellyi]MDQ2098258.1 sulfotransferase [Tychonema bourrellyi B0820]PHX55817.1 polysaccharide deacetylase [Tychonema bourrellyi FEM_GT703]
MKRIFLVGSPRSGTTILQSLLAAHPEIISFPESKFFHYLLYEEFATKLPSRLETFFRDEINRPEFLHDFDNSQKDENKAAWFVRILDGLAVEENKSIWLEKTPEHIYFIQDIQRLVPDAKFIHILRNGMDTIASLYEATRTFSNLWGGVWDLEHCIERWKDAVLISHKYVNESRHMFVKYEELIDNKNLVLAGICDFIGIEYDAAMLINYKKNAANLSLNLPWHQGITRDVQSTNIHKYHENFNRHQIQSILTQIQWVNSQIAYQFNVEVSQPILDIELPQIFDRTYCTIQLEGVELGIIELPVCDGIVAGVVLADAIASEFAWEIIKRFFQQNPENLPFEWTVFLQQIWNRPNWVSEYFYNPETADESFTINLDRDLIAVEVSAELPNIKVELSEIDVLVKVGGVAIGIITVAVENNLVSAQKVRSAITQNCGFELCVACVREALVGKSLSKEMSLRSRLTSAAQKMANAPKSLNAEGSGGIYPPHAVMFGRREGAIGTSVNRRATLPAAAMRELTEVAAIAGEPISQIPLEKNLPKQVFYAPEIIWRKSPYREISQSLKPQFFDNNNVTENLPILAYNRICTEIFEQHLQNLKDCGYYSVSWEDWQNAKLAKTPLPGKAVLLTFDGGYLDFFNHAFPLLKRFNFTATVFLVAESIGKTNSWEKADSEQVQLMGWREIRQLRDAGIEFGSMSATYQPLTGLSPTEIVREAAKSRAILELGLGKPVKCFAYPYGNVDKIVEHLVGAIGYTYGVSYESKFSNFEDSLLSLPRIQVTTENALLFTP